MSDTTWVLVNGSLTIPGTGIEIRQAERQHIPYTLHSPMMAPMAYFTLESAKIDGEKFAKDYYEEFQG